MAIAACAPCPIPQTQPAPAPPASRVEPSWVEAADTLVVATDTPRVALVRMLTTQEGASGQFSPDEIRVRHGDVLRFWTANGGAIHYVSFASVNRDKPGVALPADSPMLMGSGQSWRLRIDLPAGTYKFACVVHVLLGMRGTLIVDR